MALDREELARQRRILEQEKEDLSTLAAAVSTGSPVVEVGLEPAEQARLKRELKANPTPLSRRLNPNFKPNPNPTI